MIIIVIIMMITMMMMAMTMAITITIMIMIIIVMEKTSSRIKMADMPKGNRHQEKSIQLNLCQANMTASFLSKRRLRGKSKSLSQELTKCQFSVIILGNLSKNQKHTAINSVKTKILF